MIRWALLVAIAMTGAVAEARYLLSDVRYLHAGGHVLAAVVLSPESYFLSADYRPSPLGRTLEDAALAFSREGAALILRQYRAFYADIPEACAYLESRVAPTIENDAILDGHSNLLLLYVDGVLAGTLKASWNDPRHPGLAFQDDEEAVENVDWEAARELREIRHLVVEYEGNFDGFGHLFRFGRELELVGPRTTRRWLAGRLETRKVDGGAYYAVTSLRRLARYYRRRAHFEEVPELSARYGAHVLRVPSDAALSNGVTTALPGAPSVEEAWRTGTLEAFGPVEIFAAIQVRHWGATDLVASLRSGTFHPVTHDERCADWLARGFPVPRRYSPSFQGLVNP